MFFSSVFLCTKKILYTIFKRCAYILWRAVPTHRLNVADYCARRSIGGHSRILKERDQMHHLNAAPYYRPHVVGTQSFLHFFFFDCLILFLQKGLIQVDCFIIHYKNL